MHRPLVSSLCLSVACAAPVGGQDDPAADPEPGGDSGLFEDTGCGDPAGLIQDVEVVPTGVATVFDVRWRTAAPTTGWLEVADATGGVRSTAGSPLPSTDHQHRLTGLAQLRAHDVRIHAEAAGMAACHGPVAVDTGALSPWLPPLISEQGAADAPGYRVVPVIGERSAVVAIVNGDGEYVWAFEHWIAAEGDPEGLPIVFRAELAADGSGVVFNTQPGTPDGDGVLHRVDWGGVRGPTVRIPGGHTDFAQLPNGGLAMLTWPVEEHGGRPLLGDRIVERSADGRMRTVWDVFDTLEPDLSQSWSTGFFDADHPVEDWSHVNSIHYDAEQDDYLVTITVNNGVARIDRQTGEVTWMLSETDGDFDLGGRALVSWPHSVQPVEGGLLVFNRRSPGDPGTCSSATEIGLDHDAGVATEAWSHATRDCRQVGFLGNSLRLPSGNTLTSWSVYGMMDEVTPEGEVVWSVGTGIGGAFGFVSWAPLLPGAPR